MNESFEKREAEEAPAKWDEVFAKIVSEADADIWHKQGLRLTWKEVELLASELRSAEGRYLSAVKGRADFRRALRESRDEALNGTPDQRLLETQPVSGSSPRENG